MSNNLSAEVKESCIVKFKEYLDDVISPEDLAFVFRKYNFLMIRALLENKDSQIEGDFISEAHYHLNELSEILDPYFKKENV